MRLLLLFFITLVLPVSLSSCGTLIKVPVTVNDETLYYLKQSSTDQWAVQMYFLSSGQSQVTQDSWNKISQGMACMSLSAFEDFNTEIGKLCSQVPCDYKYTQALTALIARMKSAQGQI